MKIYKEDKGEKFGTWNDKVSKFLYYDSTKEILSKIKIPNKVADYGGANGLLKKIIPNCITIDKDKSKNPDILDNIITHSRQYDLTIIRYVLHYLNDYEVLELFKNINAKNILVIQFENNDLKSKYHNSLNEFKYFRTETQLKELLPNTIKEIYKKEYELGSEFYNNRLGEGDYITHKETLKAYYV
jgi:hypothetical protein